jgi:hypothetical protein
MCMPLISQQPQKGSGAHPPAVNRVSLPDVVLLVRADVVLTRGHQMQHACEELGLVIA